MLRTTVTIPLTRATAIGVVIHPQPVIVTPGMNMLPNHKIEALNRREPIPKVITRKRLVSLNTRGQSKKIRNELNSVKIIADKTLLMLRPDINSEIRYMPIAKRMNCAIFRLRCFIKFAA